MLFFQKNVFCRFGAIRSRFTAQLGQNRNQREKLVIEHVLDAKHVMFETFGDFGRLLETCIHVYMYTCIHVYAYKYSGSLCTSGDVGAGHRVFFTWLCTPYSVICFGHADHVKKTLVYTESLQTSTKCLPKVSHKSTNSPPKVYEKSTKSLPKV